MSNTFKNRVFGCVVIKSVNSNYNADFSHQPRTLPDGSVYATDKALKYTVRNYIDKNYNALYGELEPFIKLHQKTDGFTYRLGCFNRLRIELGFAEEIANKLYDKLMDIIYNKLSLKGEYKYINSEDKNRIETILKSYHFMKSKIKIIDIDIDLLDHGITDDIIYTKEELVSKKKNIIEIKKKLDDLIPRLDNHSRKFIEMKYLQGEKYNNIRKELKLGPVAAKELSEQIYIKVYNCLF